ncbi:unnamed protein product [Rotaria sp. Silwood1]|nr:unnamed protein product [Rotaria sp. Silwood1]
MEIENGKYRTMSNYQQIEIQADHHDKIYSMMQQEIVEDKQEIIDNDQPKINYSASISTHQFTAFAVAGSKLTERIRTKAFACLLRQEVAYFDRSENSSGAICHHLLSDALSIQQIAATRLGYICETLAMFILGIILGFLFNYQFTLIVIFILFIVAMLTYINIIFEMRLHKECHDDRLLLNALSHEAELVGVRKMIAGISDLGNERSISLHRSAEFTHVGILRTCGWKFNR